MELGKDPEEHFEQLSKDNETLDQLGLVLDSDPRKINNSGSLQGEDENGSTQEATEQE
jgi:capsid protein